MVVTPPPAPYTVPVEETVATPRLVLVHMPPVGELDNNKESPWQILEPPTIAVGVGLTVTDMPVAQPVPSV